MPAPRFLPGGDAGETWVEAWGRYVASEDESPRQAKEKTLRQAERRAVQHAAGVDLRSSYVDMLYEGSVGAQFVGLFVDVGVRALILEEEPDFLPPRPVDGGALRYDVRLRARIAKPEGTPDPGFVVDAKLNRQTYISGQEITVEIRSSVTARLYLFGVSGLDRSATQLFPNRYQRDNVIEANEPRELPPPEHRDYIAFTVSTPPGAEQAAEAMVLVVSRVPLQILEARNEATPEESSSPKNLAPVWRALLKLDRSLWHVMMLPYLVRSR